MQQKCVTLKDVAELAHTSTATVSYVINGGTGRYVSEELRQRVVSAAKELNYVKSALASGLKGKRRGVIAVTVPQFENIFFTRLVLAVEKIATEQGFLVTVSNTYDDPSLEKKVIESLIQQRVDGIILIPTNQSEASFENIRRAGIPVVIAERPLFDGDYDYVRMDNFEAAYLLTRSLLDHGHRDIGFVTWEAAASSLQDRLKGYQAALQEKGIPFHPEYVYQGEYHLEEGKRMTKELLEQHPELTAIVYGQHAHAQGGLMAIREQGIRIPEDLSVAVLGDPDWIDLYEPALTHVTLPAREVGAESARILFKYIISDGNYSSAERILISGSFAEGNSIKII